MSMHIKAVVDKFVRELKEALEADIQDRIMKEREMQSYIEEREREVAEREAAWKAELSRREAEIARQEARLKIERENLEKEKSVLMGTASTQDNLDGALEITIGQSKRWAIFSWILKSQMAFTLYLCTYIQMVHCWPPPGLKIGPLFCGPPTYPISAECWCVATRISVMVDAFCHLCC